ncbi:MAG: hypothetical protein EBW39_05575 [Betaproteobacteria bacterium]|nr:hypothetical protein [Betaproteobacteria bacterium]
MGDIRCIGIVGAGTMGQGIAQVCAQAGYAVVLQDIAAAALDRALKSIGAQLDPVLSDADLGAIDPEQAPVVARNRLHRDIVVCKRQGLGEADNDQPGQGVSRVSDHHRFPFRNDHHRFPFREALC